MLIVVLENLNQFELRDKYEDKINCILPLEQFMSNNQDSEGIISYIEAIKKSIASYDVTIIPYFDKILACLMALNIKFTIVVSEVGKLNSLLDFEHNIFTLDGLTLEQYLGNHFEWISITEDVKNNIAENKDDDSTNNNIEVESTDINEENNNQTENAVIENIQEPLVVPTDKNKLSLEQLISDDIDITEADVRDLKATQNKLKVGMLLQAKSSLNRVLKLSTTLDKLYDKLLERIDNSIDTVDTASLMYTTEYISKALSDTNQFIVSLISNEKIQNFFIIDNSSVINVSDDRVDINKRERIRKAVEIVLDNIDYFQEGEFDKLKNPNIIEVKGEDTNANTET